MSDELQAVVDGRVAEVFRGIGLSWEPPARLSVVDWCESNVVLGKESAEPGPIRIRARTPFLVEPLESFADPAVEKIVFKASAQTVKTTFMLCALAYAISGDPGPIQYVMPDQVTAKNFWRGRIRETFYNSPALVPMLPGDRTDFVAPFDFGTCTMKMGWSGSAASIASDPIRYVLADEVDKFQRTLDEAPAHKLAEERAATYWNRKIIEASTPTTDKGTIAQEYAASDQRTYQVPCPRCGEFQVLALEQIKLPETERNLAVIRAERLAWYECAHCKGRIDEHEKRGMVALGVWCPAGCEVDRDGRIVGEIPVTLVRGYWINRLYSPWCTWSEVVTEFMAVKDDPGALQNFLNSWLGLEWVEVEEEASAGDVGLLESDYVRGELPEGVLALYAGVDVQARNVWSGVWGFGERGERVWLVEHGDYPDLETWWERVMVRDWRRADGSRLRVYRAAVDSSYRSEAVYKFGRLHRDRVVVVKGSNKAMAGPHEFRQVETDPRTRKRSPVPVMYLAVNTPHFKGAIAAAVAETVRNVRGEEGAVARVHVYRGVEEEWIRQFTNERKVLVRDRQGRTRGEWQPRYAGAPNHAWDAAVYAWALADFFQVWALRAPREGAGSGPPSGGGGRARTRGRGGWLERAEHWLDS